MRKVFIAGVLVAGFLATSVHANENGAKIFKKKTCASCHSPDKDQLKMGLGPSLKQISVAYKGKEADLVNFFKGTGAAIVAPEKFATMKAQLGRFKGLSDAELNDLASFITSH